MKLPQFTLRDLFWLVFVICLALGWWLEQPSRRPSLSWFRKPLRPMVYYVEDLVPLQPSPQGGVPLFDVLVSEIKANVTQDDWASAGGAAEVNSFETNMSLVVRHSEEGHAVLAAYLAAKRTQQSPATELPPHASRRGLPRGSPAD